jgi:glycine/D-amino acid oxidase-like deaminating enzyme
VNAASGLSPAPHDYAATSFWLSTAGDLTPRPSLTRDISCDVAILGGGYSGLWTAYHLLRDHPDLDVVIIERDICGYGASGRNGGWCSPRFPVDAHALIRRYGVAKARETLLALQGAVEDIGEVCRHEAIDAHYRANGLLSIARGAHQMPGLVDAKATYDRLGIDGNRLLGAEETFERVHATGIAGALQTRAGATVHPARLARGLARAVEKRGAMIFERTEATAIVEGAHAGIVTAQGRVLARRAVVAAGEAYLTGLAPFRRALLPMSSMIVLTEPLSAAKWREIGWADGESLSSQVHTKNYLTRTADGRILYGSRGAPYLYGSAMPEEANRDEAMFAWMRDRVRQWWPALSDVAFTHSWGGYLGVPRDWMPTVGFDPERKLGQLHGYTGRGVSTSALSGRLLAGLIGGTTTGLESLPLHRRSTPRWEPEPLRWAGVRYVQNAFGRIDDAEEAGRHRPLDAALAEAFGEQ